MFGLFFLIFLLLRCIIELLPCILIGVVIVVLIKLCIRYISNKKEKKIPAPPIQNKRVTNNVTTHRHHKTEKFADNDKEKTLSSTLAQPQEQSSTAGNTTTNRFEETSQVPVCTIKPLDDIIIYKVSSILLSYNVDFLKKKNADKLDLYDFILEAAKERIDTAKRDYVKNKYKIVIQIVQLLQKDAEMEEILHAVFSVIEKDVTKQAIAKSIEEVRKLRNRRKAEIVRKTVISQIILGLQNNAIKREECRLRERLQVLHRKGDIKEEIAFIKETIQYYESLDIPCEYWRLLLEKRMEEVDKQAQIVKLTIAQIILALEDNIAHREIAKKEQPKENHLMPLVLQRTSTSSQLTVDKKADEPPCQWVGLGEEINVCGIKLRRGNFYIGKHFVLPRKTDSFSFWGSYIYGSVLNPTLTIKDNGTLNDTFSSYEDMTPFWRFQYLLWLSGDIEITAVPVEILFFYLYGCEIRMFVDDKTNIKERRDILMEMIQIRKSLDNQGFVNAAYQLLKRKLDDFIGHTIVKFFNKDIESFSIKSALCHCEQYKMAYIIHRFNDKHILSLDDAYILATEIFDIDGIVPARHLTIAQKQFNDNYIKEREIITKQLKTPETIYFSHHDVSYCHNNYCNFCSEKIELFHIIKSSTRAWVIYRILNDSYKKILSVFDHYNRIKQNHNGEETIAAITFLPDEIDIKEEPKIKPLIASIEKMIQSEKFGVLNVDEILKLWEYEHNEAINLPKKDVDIIIFGLSRLGYGIVPNYEIDKRRFNFGDLCVVYKNEEQYSVKQTAQYDISELFIKLASHIVHASIVSNNDFEFVEQHLKSYDNTQGNYLHLRAVIRWRFLSKKQKLDKSVQSIIATLTNEQRISMGNALNRLAYINGDIHPKRMEGLKKVLPLLGIEVDNIHSQTPRILTDEDGFAVVEKKSDAVEFTINEKSAQTQQDAVPSVIINPKKLRIFEQQTQAAQELLSDIFADEDGVKNETSVQTSSDWIEMLNILLSKDIWERVEVENMCKERGLMLGAVLEQINDFAYEKVGDTVIEDDGENIYVTLDYKEQII